VKIVDFGVAKMVGHDVTKTGMTKGTVAYMSPEQATGEAVDHRTDLWSLGVVLYEMLTGDRPFKGDSEPAVVYSIISEPPAPLAAHNPALPKGLQSVLDRMLAKERDGRFESASDLAADVERLRVDPDSAAGVTSTPGQSSNKRPRLVIALGATLVAAIGVAGWFAFGSGGSDPELPTFAGNVRQLTSILGNTYAPSWNPDASMIAYGHTAEGDMDIYVMTVAGGDPLRLTDHPADDIGPRWSPTGDKIAFFSDRGTGIKVFWIAPTGGERELTTTNIPFMERSDAWFRGLGMSPWSPDGRQLLFPRMEPTGETAIWVIDVETLDEKQLTYPEPGVSDMGASWSPDGRQIVFDRSEHGFGDLWVLRVSENDARQTAAMTNAEPQPTPLYRGQHNDFAPAWTPDGQRVLFLSSPTGDANAAFWELDVGSNATRQLTTGLFVFAYSVAGDGSVAYAESGHQSDVFWADVGSPAESHQNVTRNTRNNFGARIAPDGRRLVYHSDRSGSYDIWIRDRDTGSDTPITEDGAIDVMPHWSEDGEIFFLSNRGGTFQMWTTTERGGRPRLLSPHTIPVRCVAPVILCRGPHWSPGGSQIGFIAPADAGDALWLVTPDGTPEPVGLAGILDFDWYQDDRRVLYTRRAPDGSGNMELRARHLATGEDVTLFVGPVAEPTVRPDGRAVAYLYAASHYEMDAFMLRLRPPPTEDGLPTVIGEPEQLTSGRGIWHTHNLSWAADGRSFVYTRDEDRGDIYLLEPRR
jgi:Tol biopolymer transport system component